MIGSSGVGTLGEPIHENGVGVCGMETCIECELLASVEPV